MKKVFLLSYFFGRRIYFVGQLFLISYSAFPQNVGIGITTPVFKLDVRNGSINTDSAYRIGTNTVLSVAGNFNLFAGINTGSVNTGSGNTFIGSSAGYLNTTGDANTFLGGSAGASNTTAGSNTFVGHYAGNSNTTGNNNAFFGAGAGQANSTGTYNSFFGRFAGNSNTNNHNSFFGYNSGGLNTIGMGNSFFGSSSGNTNNSGIRNSFFGSSAGYSNTDGNYNCFYGYSGGSSNTSGGLNAFYGSTAGASNTTGSFNVFFGEGSGDVNTTGSSLTLLGASTNVLVNNLSNATAIGYQTIVNQSNLMVFGNSSVLNWGFGIAPAAGRAFQVGFNSTNGNGAHLTDGGVWTNGSSRHFKEDFHKVDGHDILKRIMALHITRWKYKGSVNEYHIGPVAEEFYSLFRVGDDEKYLSTIDPAGVALVGIQQLVTENEENKKTIDRLLERMNKILEELEMLKKKNN